MSADVETREVPLFPLHTVLFPGGPLALRIFEPRYLDMVSECLRNDQPFGVCLIQSGNEAGVAASPHLTGTFARIVDWQSGDDGLLSISARGEQRFHVQETRIERDQLPAEMRADVERWIEDFPKATTFVTRLYAEER